MKGKITLQFSRSSRGSWRLRIEDAPSHSMLIDAELSADDLSDLLATATVGSVDGIEATLLDHENYGRVGAVRWNVSAVVPRNLLAKLGSDSDRQLDSMRAAINLLGMEHGSNARECTVYAVRDGSNISVVGWSSAGEDALRRVKAVTDDVQHVLDIEFGPDHGIHIHGYVPEEEA